MKKVKMTQLSAFLLVLMSSLSLLAEDKAQEIFLNAVNKNEVSAASQVLAWVDVNEQDAFGWTVLMRAAMYGYLEMVQLLLNEGALVNTQNKDGDTALMLAASRGHQEIVMLLLAKGADVQLVNSQGESALEMAKNNGHNEVVRIIQNFIAKKRAERRAEVSQAILKARPEGYPDITEEIAEFEIGK